MRKHTVAAAAASLLASAGLARPADAAYTVTFTQSGANVDVAGSGTLDTTGLDLLGSGLGPDGAFVLPSGPAEATGAFADVDAYDAVFSGPSDFGSGGSTPNTSGSSGDLVGIFVDTNVLIVPLGYVSGASVSDSAVYDDETFAGLGMDPGTYTWTWGSGANTDSFTIQVGPASSVPEPASLALFAPALAGLGVTRRRRSRTAAPLA
jgi:hypothetical protein